MICRQTHETTKAQEKYATSNEKHNNKKQYKSSKLTEGKMGKVKCKSCLKEYFDINNHLSKAFSCQNAYDIEKALDDSFEKEGIVEDCNFFKPRSPLSFEEKNRKSKPSVPVVQNFT